MLEVLALARRVEPEDRLERLAVGARPSPRARRRRRGPSIANSSSPVRPSDSRRLAGPVLEREDAHHQQVRAVDPLVALGDHGADAEERRALRGPVAGGAGAVLLAGEDDSGVPSAR